MAARFWILAFLTCCSNAQPDKVHTFQLPENWRKATSASLIIQGLEAPKNRAVILRVITADSSSAELGSYTLMAESPEAKGNWQRPRVEIKLTTAFRKWAETKEDTREIRLRIRPYAGLKEAPDYKWTAKEIRLEVR